MKIDWEWKFGPASVLTVIGALAQAAVMIWLVSSSYTGLTKSIEVQGVKIEEVKSGSDKRFETIRDAIKESRQASAGVATEVSGIKSTLTFLTVQFNRLEDRINGK